ncbi:MAG: hypothetical protein EHM20_15050 [Alphaproteobacteria bacterium]|nr:MAG: hypothetical protein EHM20_15050 [Alphaproteobacteria bacterium]
MKKLLFASILSITLLFSSSSYAIDPKLKILGSMAGYGVVGGALLGTASLAFGASGRAIAKGASLGLYGGLIFGTYVILSYEMKKNGFGGEPQRENYYPDARSEYEDEEASIIAPNLEEYHLAAFENKKDPKKDPLISFNFLNYQF